MKVGALGERSRRGRYEHLAAVAAGCDTVCAVDVRADVALRGYVRSSRMQAHAHTDRAGLKSMQSLGRRFERRRRGPECDEERVTLRVDLPASVGVERRSKDAAVLG